MRKTLEKYLPHWQSQFIWAIVMGTCFTVIGVGLPYANDHYLDKTEYVKIENPITTDLKIYKPGDEVKINTRIVSLVDVTSEVKLELALVREDNVFDIVQDYRYPDFIIHKGEQAYAEDFNLPDDLEDGIYLYQGALRYKVADIEKVFYFYTGRFHVSATGEAQTDALPNDPAKNGT